MARTTVTLDLSHNQGNRIVIRRLDILLTTLLIIFFVPLSIWGGVERWAHDTEYLVLVLIALGGAYAVIMGSRTRSALLGAASGIIAGVMMYVPSTFFSVMENDIPGFIIVMAVFTLMGIVSAVISARKRDKSAVPTKRKGQLKAAVSEKGDGVMTIGRDAPVSPARQMLSGLIYAAGGILIAILSYSAIASTGGVYFVAWGAVLYGGVNLFAGVVGLFKKQK